MFGKAVPIEEYEMVSQSRDDLEGQLTNIEGQLDLVDNRGGLLHEIDDVVLNSSRRSSQSESSVVFEDIDDFAKNNHETDDDFNTNPIFQSVYFHYKNSGTLGRKALAIAGTLIGVIWVIGVLFYSNSSGFNIVSSMTWKTNVQVTGKNVTLNAYNPLFQNVSMAGLRKGTYYAYHEEVRWLNPKQYPKSQGSGGYYLSINRNTITINQIDSKYSATLIDNVQFSFKNNFFYIQDMKLNPAKSVEDRNDNYHIVVTDKLEQWRHLSFAIYWIYNVATAQYIPIQPPKNMEKLKSTESKPQILDKLHFADFSPKGDHVIFGFNHDLYIQNLKTNAVNQITTDGSKHILNGKPDWIYEEEVTADYKLFWWSPDQANLIFAKLNDTKVQEYELDYYIKDRTEIGTQYEESDELKVENVNQYPIKTAIKYPKPGTSNPLVTLHNYQLSDNSITLLQDDTSKVGEDFILYDGAWIDNYSFLIKITDRTSRILSKRLFQMQKTPNIVEVSTIDVRKEYNGYVGKLQPITVIPGDGDNAQYIDRIIINGKSHLALFENAEATTYSKLLTESNDWQVVTNAPVVYDKLEHSVYTLTTMRSSMDAHLISIDLSKDKDNIQVITDTEKDGLYDISFSGDGQYLNLFYRGPLQPWQRLINMADLHTYFETEIENDISHADIFIASHKVINHFEVTKANLKDTNIPTKLYKTITVGTTKDKKPINLNVIEILPPNFNPEKKHPLLVHAYGGPGSQTVDKSFSIDFQDVVSSLGVVVLIIDPRGTGGQGWEFKSYANDKIGYWEPRDLTTVVSEYISANKKFIDKEKTAIWGWSYGGFTTLKTLEYDVGKTFKFGMAVAPVTNWLFYDSIYTERYMGSPSTNPNYEKYARINDYDNFLSLNRFLIMHGTSDDNVHLQNLLWLLDKFNLNNVKNYDVYFFPDSDHAINYHNAHSIVYDKLINWLQDAFIGRFDALYRL